MMVCVMVKKVSNFPINLTNETARLEFISSSVSHELFQGKEVILVDVDNLKNHGLHCDKRFVSIMLILLLLLLLLV